MVILAALVETAARLQRPLKPGSHDQPSVLVDLVLVEDLILGDGKVHRTDAGQRLELALPRNRSVPVHSDAIVSG